MPQGMPRGGSGEDGKSALLDVVTSYEGKSPPGPAWSTPEKSPRAGARAAAESSPLLGVGAASPGGAALASALLGGRAPPARKKRLCCGCVPQVGFDLVLNNAIMLVSEASRGIILGTLFRYVRDTLDDGIGEAADDAALRGRVSLVARGRGRDARRLFRRAARLLRRF